MLPVWNDSGEARQVPLEETAASRLIIGVLAALIIAGLAIAAACGGGELYGLSVWVAFMAWIPAVIIVGPFAEKHGWMGFPRSP